MAVGDRPPCGDERCLSRRLVGAGVVRTHVVAAVGISAGATSPADLSILAASAPSTELAVSEVVENGRGLPNVLKALCRKIARDHRHIRTRGDLTFGRDAHIVDPARAAGLIVQQGRLRIAVEHMTHQLGLALRADHHAAAIHSFQNDEFPQDIVVLLRTHALHELCSARGDHEVNVEGNGPRLRRPASQLGDLVPIAGRYRRLNDEVELPSGATLDGGHRVGECTPAVPKSIMIFGTERVDAHSDTLHAGIHQRVDALAGQASPVRADPGEREDTKCTLRAHVRARSIGCAWDPSNGKRFAKVRKAAPRQP